jgi:hypothetical protein
VMEVKDEIRGRSLAKVYTHLLGDKSMNAIVRLYYSNPEKALTLMKELLEIRLGKTEKEDNQSA